MNAAHKSRSRIAVAILALVVTGLTAPPAVAGPKPDIEALRRQAERLNSQAEQLTEQYDGLRVRLQQAQNAAASAQTTARAAAADLRAMQAKVGRLAAQRYMTGYQDQAPVFTSDNPESLLDQTATLHFFTQQDDSQIGRLTEAIQNAERTRVSAQDRLTQVALLKTQLTRKKAGVRKALEQVRKPLLKDAIERAGKGQKIPEIPGGSSKGLGAVRAALSQLGVKYVWGGASPSPGFDCSGLTMWAYKQVGINLPHYGGDQWNAGVHVSRADLQPGDLVFFYSDIHHMGMYIGDGKFVHAPHTGDVVRIAELSTRPLAGAVRVV